MPGRIKWDQTGERWYEIGLDHGVLYPAASGGGYDHGVAWNGLTAVTESPEGAEPTDMWADNMKYATIRSAESFAGTIEAYTYPPEFAACNGEATVAKGATIGQQSRKSFAFCYRTKIGNDTGTEEDDGYKLHIVYGATVSPSEVNYETVNDSPEANSLSWEFTTNPVAVDGFKPTATMVIDSRKADPTKMKQLEDKLYGTDAGEEGTPAATEPTLMMPGEIITLLGQPESAFMQAASAKVETVPEVEDDL